MLKLQDFKHFQLLRSQMNPWEEHAFYYGACGGGTFSSWKIHYWGAYDYWDVLEL